MRKKWKVAAVILYFVFAVWLLFFFPFTHASRLNPEARRYVTLAPFENTSYYLHQAWRYQDWKNISELLANVGGNIVLFVPLGVILSSSGLLWYVVFLIGLWSSLSIESLQILTYVGNFDVDDIIWNTTGTMLGFLLWRRK